MRKFFPHEMFVYGVGDASQLRLIRLINIDFPTGYLQSVLRPDQVVTSPTVKAWVQQRTPVFIRCGAANPHLNPSWVQVARSHDVRNIASHGLIESCETRCTYFSFGRVTFFVNSKTRTGAHDSRTSFTHCAHQNSEGLPESSNSRAWRAGCPHRCAAGCQRNEIRTANLKAVRGKLREIRGQ